MGATPMACSPQRLSRRGLLFQQCFEGVLNDNSAFYEQLFQARAANRAALLAAVKRSTGTCAKSVKGARTFGGSFGGVCARAGDQLLLRGGLPVRRVMRATCEQPATLSAGTPRSKVHPPKLLAISTKEKHLQCEALQGTIRRAKSGPEAKLTMGSTRLRGQLSYYWRVPTGDSSC
jgi:hypothetical protein